MASPATIGTVIALMIFFLSVFLAGSMDKHVKTIIAMTKRHHETKTSQAIIAFRTAISCRKFYLLLLSAIVTHPPIDPNLVFMLRLSSRSNEDTIIFAAEARYGGHRITSSGKTSRIVVASSDPVVAAMVVATRRKLQLPTGSVGSQHTSA